MKATIKWGGDVKFIGESGTGHTVIMDGPDSPMNLTSPPHLIVAFIKFLLRIGARLT
jgi:uncharacterized OsmC-like protein